ncbi:MAG: hypothetical protein LIO65_06070 [Odoribacter sp.]|nr:hypothetical protein [Odoribacter sp.]
MLRNFFPDSTLKIVGYDKGLIWEGRLLPSNLSLTYDIRIEYNIGYDPNIYVLTPNPLPMAKGETKLPHIYDHKKQHLCLYHRRMNEWNERKMIAKTIIPWTSEWLLHYEIWVTTGTWHGGGIH